MRVGYVFIPDFAVQVERIRRGELRGRPLVIGGSPLDSGRVYAVSSEAACFGVVEGMSLRKAYVLCPQAHFMPPDERGYWQAFEAVIRLVEEFSSVVETERLGCAYFGFSDFGNEDELAREVGGRILQQTGIRACLGIGRGKFIAGIAARVARPDCPIVVASGDERAFLSSLPVDLLPCSQWVKERLSLFGIRRIGELAWLSREALRSQFASEGEFLYRLVHGVDTTVLRPRQGIRRIVRVIQPDEPISTIEGITGILGKVISEVALGLGDSWEVCHKLTVRLFLCSKKIAERCFTLRRGASCPTVMLSLVRLWLDGLKLDAEIESIELCFEVARENGLQLTLWEKVKPKSIDDVCSEILRKGRWQRGLSRVAVGDPHAFAPEQRFKLIRVAEGKDVQVV